MKLPLSPYAKDGVLAGSIEGKKAFADLLRKTQIPASPEVCFLDFTGIDVATSSFLRDGPVAYRTHARATWPMLYPVGANLLPRVREELETFLVDRADAIVTCSLDAKDRVSKVEVIGQIDGKQRLALQGILHLGEADAPSLRDHAGEEVAPTAWNNRLVALVVKGIVMEVSTGRNKRYRPVLEGMQYGT
jgi:hypothetical protein